MKKYKSRDFGVELFRLLGSLIVIGVHSCLNVFHDNICDLSRLYISCCFADGVAIFWLITGFFLYSETSYSKLLRKLRDRTIIPMLCYGMFYFYFSSFFINGTFTHHNTADYLFILHCLFRFRNPFPTFGQSWYLFTYIFVYFLFPIIKPFIMYLDADPRRIRTFLFISLLMLLINDFTYNELLMFSHHSVNAIFPAILQTIWGHILFQKRHYFTSSRYAILCAFLFPIINMIRMFIQHYLFRIKNGNGHILYWYSTIGQTCACVICIFCFSFSNVIKTMSTRTVSQSIALSINYLASLTFDIYLIHLFVRDLLTAYKFDAWLFTAIIGKDETFVSTFLYSISMIIIIFILSALLTYVKSFVIYTCKHIVHFSTS